MKTIGLKKIHVTKMLSFNILNFGNFRFWPHPMMRIEIKRSVPIKKRNSKNDAKTAPADDGVSPSMNINNLVYSNIATQQQPKERSLNSNFATLTSCVSFLLQYFGCMISSSALIFATVRSLALPNSLVDFWQDVL
mmetsp:Transcript_28139/g.40738  ORF Transcript_28139/g.40738 Transcript_28139/m.40738 type:complete len:136 (+) Transcript_28139:947-1354(+)